MSDIIRDRMRYQQGAASERLNRRFRANLPDLMAETIKLAGQGPRGRLKAIANCERILDSRVMDMEGRYYLQQAIEHLEENTGKGIEWLRKVLL